MKIPPLVVVGVCLLILFLGISPVSSENYIGIILDGYQNDCLVTSRGEDYACKENMQLYTGDMVIKKPDVKTLKVKWAPYAGGKQLDLTSMIVTFEPPKNKKGFLSKVKEFLGLMKTGHTKYVGATREITELLIPQPGNNATLISGQKTTFSWESDEGKYIIFKNDIGLELFKKDLNRESSIQLSPEEIGMKTGMVYVWNIRGIKGNKPFKIRLLAQDTAQQVTGDLMQIDKEPISNFEKILKKAIYLQFISDAYPNEMDLYWLSYLFLDQIKDETVLARDDKVILDELKKNYLRHVRESMY